MRALVIVLSILLLSACNSMQTSWDFNPVVDFSKYHTYAWVNKRTVNKAEAFESLSSGRVHSVVDTNLTEKGLKVTSKKSAQLLVNYLTETDKKLDVETFNTGFGYAPYLGPDWWWNEPQTTTSVHEYKERIFILDLIDAKTKKIVWRGTLEEPRKEGQTPEQRWTDIEKEVTELLKDYPPKSKI